MRRIQWAKQEVNLRQRVLGQTRGKPLVNMIIYSCFKLPRGAVTPRFGRIKSRNANYAQT